ncbi:DEAD/DEAH box helicase [Sulfurovum sp.]|uniref:DEAD/DEAH box helicase n=1 Tax=Sulfurovum sp. TaxID=1969726 RepID=UPI00356AED55
MANKILGNDDIEQTIVNIINTIHKYGPVNTADFEKLAYIKKLYPEILYNYEKKLLSAMGLFYKVQKPKSILEEVYSIYEDTIVESTGRNFTPVQAHAYLNIRDKKYFSFSAPTSAGKSYLFRELIQNVDYDIVIIVPSRALITEYVKTVTDLLSDDKSILILPFIENINISRIKRRIFILTPERGVELFKRINEFNIGLFLLDEAQISEEGIRGMKFDAFVRRIDKSLPNAKKVFAHPFVNNPDAQLKKHNFTAESSSFLYQQHSVGKIFLAIDNSQLQYFSPYQTPNNRYLNTLETDIVDETLARGGTLLVYISKNKIYDGTYLTDFSKYIDNCQKLTDVNAIQLIEKLRVFIGASKTGVEKHSLLIDMMEKGIVIHHGSMPLNIRLIIEEFIKAKYAHICFATATLIQGINMPFDIVWIDNFHNLNTLNLKNLIGRAGRTTSSNYNFEFGYTIVKKINVPTFCSRINDTILLDEVSLIDKDISTMSDDVKDIVEAVKNDTYNDELHLTNAQVDRLRESNINPDIKYILDNILLNGQPINGNDYYNLDNKIRNKVKDTFKKVYVKHLRRQSLNKAEASVLSASIPIMLWHIQGKSFSEMVSLRYAFLTEKDKKNKILSNLRHGKLSATEANSQIAAIEIRFTPSPSSLPNSQLKISSLFSKGTSINDLDYDTLVYDTYDYLDKVISLSLVDPLCGAFELYYNDTHDPRALIMKNFLRFGTNDELEIWLLRYGFGFEDIEWITEYIDSINENEIIFNPSINNLSPDMYEVISRYV